MNLFFIILFFNIDTILGFNILTNTILTYSGYSLLIDLWASTHVNNMKTKKITRIDTSFDLIENKYMISNLSNIIENLDYRYQWDLFMKTYKNNNSVYSGTYKFLHRNYVNNEEKLAICNGRNTIHKLFVKLPENGVIIIHNNTIELNELFIFFSFYPVKIKWLGNIINNEVFWNYTEFSTPNNIVKNPEKAQELSKYSWNITASTSDYIIFTKNKPNSNEQLIYGNF